MMLRGVVAEVSTERPAVRVRYPEFDMTSGWLPVVVPMALGARIYALPRQGSQVVVLADRDLDDAVVVGCLYSQADPAPTANPKVLHIETEDGTKVIIDPDAQKVTVDTPGDISARAGGNLEATAGSLATIQAPQIVLDGIVSVTKTIAVAQAVLANGGISTSSGGPVPGALSVQGTMHSETGVTSPAATIGGRDFLGHTHPTYGPGEKTGPVS